MGDRRYDEALPGGDRESQRGPLRSLDRGTREMSRDAPPGRIYVGNLPPNSDRKTLEDLFGRYGRIVDISVKRTISGTPFAFVEFGDARDAEDAIRERDSYKLDGCILRVEIPFAARGGRPGSQTTGFRGPPRRGEFRVAVRGLPPSGSWQDLKDHMREAGECVFADVFRDGTGVVEFARRADMEYALKNFQDSLFKSHEGETSHISVSRVQDDDDMEAMMSSESRHHSGSHRSQSPNRMYNSYGGGGNRSSGGAGYYYGGGGSSRNASSNPGGWSSREAGRGSEYSGSSSTRNNWHSSSEGAYGSSSTGSRGYDVDVASSSGAPMDTTSYNGNSGYYESSRDRRGSGTYSRTGRSSTNYYRNDEIGSSSRMGAGSSSSSSSSMPHHHHHHHHHSSSNSSNPNAGSYGGPSRERRSPSYSGTGSGAGYGRSRSRSRSFATRYR